MLGKAVAMLRLFLKKVVRNQKIIYGERQKMKVTMKKVAALVVATTCALTMFGCGTKKEEDGTLKFKDVENVKNVILMIGDGMGPSQIQAGELYKGSKLTMQKFP